MATRAALASRVYIAGQSIESNMAKIAAAIGVEVPPKPGGIYGKRPELREAANQDRLAQFLGAVAEKVEKPEPQSIVAAASNAVGPIVGGLNTAMPQIGDPYPSSPPLTNVRVLEVTGTGGTAELKYAPPEPPKPAKPVHKPGRK